MILIFGRNNHVVSRLIQFRTWEQWSHVGIIHGDQVIEAKGIPVIEYIENKLLKKPFYTEHGVVLTPINEFKARYLQTELRYIEGNENKALELLGRPFDMGAIFGAFLHQEWHDLNADMCVEVIVHAAENIDIQFAHKITPAMLYWFSLPVEEGEPCFTA